MQPARPISELYPLIEHGRFGALGSEDEAEDLGPELPKDFWQGASQEGEGGGKRRRTEDREVAENPAQRVHAQPGVDGAQHHGYAEPAERSNNARGECRQHRI